jgi:cation transport regulator ChaC
VRTCIFGYGSLINRQSFERALKRELSAAEFRVAEVKDYRRCWRAKENLHFEQLGRAAIGIFLDICRAPGETVNGVLVEVSDAELAQLKKREKNYDCIDISAQLDCDPRARVYTFVARAEHYLQPQDEDVYIPQRYIDMILSGGRELGEEFLIAYRRSTEDSAVLPLLDGSYRFLDAEQKKYV